MKPGFIQASSFEPSAPSAPIEHINRGIIINNFFVVCNKRLLDSTLIHVFRTMSTFHFTKPKDTNNYV